MFSTITFEILLFAPCIDRFYLVWCTRHIIVPKVCINYIWFLRHVLCWNLIHEPELIIYVESRLPTSFQQHYLGVGIVLIAQIDLFFYVKCKNSYLTSDIARSCLAFTRLLLVSKLQTSSNVSFCFPDAFEPSGLKKWQFHFEFDILFSCWPV